MQDPFNSYKLEQAKIKLTRGGETSFVYALPFGEGKRFLRNASGIANTLLADHISHSSKPLPDNLSIRFRPPGDVQELHRLIGSLAAEDLQPVLTVEEMLDLQNTVEKVRLDDSLMNYLLGIIMATRRSDLLTLGVSTRGALALCKAAKALALARDRDYCLPDDIKELAPVVLSHRVMLNRGQGFKGRSSEHAERVVQDILETVPIPL